MSLRRFRPLVTALEGRELPAALLQVINNSPYRAAADLDIYINGLLVPELTGLGYREATPFLPEPSAVPLTVAVRPAGGTAGQTLFSQTLNLAANSATVAVVLGDPGQTSGAARFQVLATPAARTAATSTAATDFTFVQGSPDAPPLDVRVRDTAATVANDTAYGGLAPGYTSVAAPGRYTVDVTRADGTTPVGAYTADFSKATGKAVTVLGSGFFGTPPAGAAAANTFGLLAVNSDGTTAPLAAAGTPAQPGTPVVTPPPAGTPVVTKFVAVGGGKATAFDTAGKAGVSVAAGVGVAAAADVTGDGVLDLIVGTGPGTVSGVQVIDGASQQVVFAASPFEAGFTGGVFVAAGDLTGDGRPDLIVTPDRGGGPVVVVYDASRLSPPGSQPLLPAEVARFYGIDDARFRGGARAAVGDINADGRPDLLVAAGFGGGPRVAVFNGATVLGPLAAGQLPPKLVGDFFVFESSLRNGVFVAAADVDGDGAADVVVGGGPGGGPRVFALSGRDLASVGKQTAVANFFAGAPADRSGVRLAAKDLDGDKYADLVVGLGAAGSPQVRGFRGKDFAASVSAGTPPAAVAGLDLNPFTNPGTVSVG